jgi:hypothetical protein
MAKLLSAVAEKAIVKLKESGALVDFYVAKHDYESGLNGTGRTLLARAEPWPTDIVWNNIRENAYADSTIDRWMNNDYKNKLDPSIQAQITETQFYYTEGNGSRKTVPLSRDIFILSGTEYGISADRMMTEGEILPIADELLSTRENEWTRSPRYNLTTSAWRCAKDISTAYEADVTYAFPARPVFQLPSTLTVSDDGVIIAPPLAPDSIAVPDTTMQGNTLPVSWTAADGADSYVLERSADSGAWTQVYSGAELSHTDTAGTWSTVQYRVKAGVSGVYGDYATSAAVAVVPASTCTISGEDGDLGTLTGDIVYTAMTSTSEPITVTETVNGTVLRTFQPVSGAQQRISVMDLPTGGGTAVIQAECSGVSVTRTWTYTKAAADFPAAPTPFDIALLSKGGRVQFPQTLAECVRMPGGTMLDRYTQHWWKRRTILQEIEIANSYAAVDLSDQPSTTAGVTISYSESAHVDAATNRIELDHPTTVDVSYSKYTNANVLAGKYFKNPVHDEIRYVEPGTQATRSSRDYSGSSSGKMYKVTIQTKATSIATEIGDWEYLQSNDRGAYPDSGISGGYEYQYLGQPFGLDNLLGGTKIATGSYTGTGKYGSDNPNTLTLDFVPQLILIFWAHSGGNAPNAIAWLGKDMGFSYKPAGSNGQWYYTYPITVLPPNGTDMRWYSPADVSAQMNGSGVEYRYFAIG